MVHQMESEISPKRRKLENIFEISETKYSNNEDIFEFYSNLRNLICNHLKKKGDKINNDIDDIMLEDETISPTFENIIILWCLEKIDPCLPNFIKDTFINQLQTNISLLDIHNEIFQVIPEFLECDIKNSIKDQVEIVENVNRKEIKNERNAQDTRKPEKSTVELKRQSLLQFGQSLHPNNKNKYILQQSIDKSTQFLCNFCVRTFKNNEELNIHKRLHSNIKLPDISVNSDNTNKNKESLKDSHFEIIEDSKNYVFNNEHLTTHDDLNVMESNDNQDNNKASIDNINDKVSNGEVKLKRNARKKRKLVDLEELIDDVENLEDLPDSKLRCKICGEIFKTNRKLLFHKQMVHGSSDGVHNTEPKEIVEEKKNMKIPCEICGKEVPRIKLKTHLLYHEKRFTCVKCDIKFETSIQLKEHANKVHPESVETKKVFCEICGKRVCNLKDHIKKRHTTKLKCSTCKRGFPNEEELNSHVCKHFKCDLCDQKFIQHRNLTLHKREHAGETFHHCDFCEGMFHSKRRMLAHRRYNHTNTTGESHECDICNKKFSILRILKRHRLIHISDERPFKCAECGMAFKMNSHMKTHMKTHGTDKKYSCEGCGKQFISVGNLKQHREKLSCGLQEDQLFKNRIEN